MATNLRDELKAIADRVAGLSISKIEACGFDPNEDRKEQAAIVSDLLAIAARPADVVANSNVERIACDVKVAPGTTFRAGVDLSTVIMGIRLRAQWDGGPFKFPRREQCCICGTRFDACEREEGGGPSGAELTDGRWTCSSTCFDRAAAVAQVGVPEGLPTALSEAAAVLVDVGASGVALPENWRWPLADELCGFAAMLSAAPQPQTDHPLVTSSDTKRGE